MSSFQIKDPKWYFQRTLDLMASFCYRIFIYSYSTAIAQLFHSLTGSRSPARAMSWAPSGSAGLPIYVFLNGFG